MNLWRSTTLPSLWVHCVVTVQRLPQYVSTDDCANILSDTHSPCGNDNSFIHPLSIVLFKYSAHFMHCVTLDCKHSCVDIGATWSYRFRGWQRLSDVKNGQAQPR